jgi:hypothetical protein
MLDRLGGRRYPVRRTADVVIVCGPCDEGCAARGGRPSRSGTARVRVP